MLYIYEFHINKLTDNFHLYEKIVKNINCQNHFQLRIQLFNSTHYLWIKINELQSNHPDVIHVHTLMNTVQTKIRAQLTPPESISIYFQDACYAGRLHITQLLFQIQSPHCSIDAHVFKNLFVWACDNNKLKVA